MPSWIVAVSLPEYELQFADIFDQIVAWATRAPIHVVNPEVLRLARHEANQPKS